MQIQTIMDVLEYIRKAMEDTNIIEVYQKFVDNAASHKASQTAEESSVFEKEKDKIIELQKKIEPKKWIYSKYRIFKEINKDNLLGNSAIDELNALIELNKNAYSSLSEPLYNIVSELKRLYEIAKTQNPVKDIQKLYLPETHIERPKENIIYIYYDGDVTIKNLKDIEKYSRIWDQILTLLHEITKETSEEISVISLERHPSYFCFGITAGKETIATLSGAIQTILEEYTRIFKIRKVQLDVISLNLTKEIIGMLEEEVQTFIHEQSVAIVDSIIQKYCTGNQSQALTDKLVVTIRQIIDFIEKGGRINFESPSLDQHLNHSLNNNYDFVSEIKEVAIETEQYIA